MLINSIEEVEGDHNRLTDIHTINKTTAELEKYGLAAVLKATQQIVCAQLMYSAPFNSLNRNVHL